MRIDHPRRDQAGYMVRWIEEDHHPAPGEDYDPTRVRYGCEIDSELDEARRALRAHVAASEVLWGQIRAVIYCYVDGLPDDWEACDPDGPPLVYAEELFDAPSETG